MIDVTFTESELAFIRNLATTRTNTKRKYSPSRKVTTRLNDMGIEVLGLMGECAVAKYLGVKVNRGTGLGGDGGTDLDWNGFTIQVKLNTYKTGDLYFFNLSKFTTDLAVLTVPAGFRTIRIVGYISRQSFNLLHGMVNYGYGEHPFVPQSLLVPMESIHGEYKEIE